MSRKVVLTCAVTGGGKPHPRHPAIPITPAQIADSCLEAAREGAAVVHIHVRNPETGMSSDDPKLFDEVVDRVRSSGVDVVINLTCGMGALFVPDPDDESKPGPGSKIYPVPQRMRHVERNLPELASFDITAGNRHYGRFEAIYMNTPRAMRLMAQRFRELGVKPELEVFDTGNLWFVRQMIKEDLIPAPALIQLCMGIPYGVPADTGHLLAMVNTLPADAVWTSFAIGRMQMPWVAQSILAGGHVRVGLEDNLYLSRGVYASNAQLVEKARTIIEAMGARIMTPAQARERLKIK